MSVIHTSPSHDGKMQGHSCTYRTNLDQIRPQKFAIGELQKVSISQRQKAPCSGEAVTISLYTQGPKHCPCSQELSLSTKPPTAPAQPRLQRDTGGESQDSQGSQETCHKDFLLQNL